jgi:ribosomal protein L40E
METIIKDSRCPKCDYKMDRASHLTVDDISPKGGDCSVCLRCGAVLMFNDDLSLREPTAKERKSFSRQNLEEILELQMYIQTLRKMERER